MTTSGQIEMTAGGLQKFMFDRDFSNPDEHDEHDRAAQEDESAEEAASEEAEEPQAEPELPPPPTFSQEDLDRAREEGRAQGREEATRDLASAMEQRIAETLQAMNAKMAQLFDVYERDKEQHSRDAMAVAVVLVRKLFPSLSRDFAMGEIERMIVEAMKRTSGSPRLIVRVAPEMQGEVEQKAQELAALRGREETLNIIGDPSVAQGDAQVEWTGGGMVRDSRFIWNEIDKIIERNLGQNLEMPPETVAPHGHGEVENPASVGENTDIPVESNGPTPAASAAGEQPADDTES